MKYSSGRRVSVETLKDHLSLERVELRDIARGYGIVSLV